MKYTTYSVKDFVADPFFQQWVTRPDAASNAFWENWLHTYPFKEPDVAEAREIIRVLGFTADMEANQDFIAVWDQIQAGLKQPEEMPVLVPEPAAPWWQRPYTYRSWAAVFIGLLVLSVGGWLLRPEENRLVTVATAFGQVRTITLPDSSQVTLNANSTLSYVADWRQADAPRQVWLKGEGFFSVRKKKQPNTADAKFKVHTSSLTVEVLGTRFNVHDRRSRTQVVLASGQVKVALPAAAGQQPIVMKPGDYVGYTAASKHLVRKTVAVKAYTSWVNNQVFFQNATLAEIALLLEDNYGYRVTFQDEALARSRFTGSIPDKNISLLFTALSRLYDLQITRDQQQVTITSNKNQ